MKHRSIIIATVLGLASLNLASSAFAKTAVDSGASLTVNAAELQSTAVRASRQIENNADAVQSLIAAGRSKNTAAAHDILLTHGFTAEQLAGAIIVVNEVKSPRDVATGQASRRITITITISTKPLVITITIRF